MRNSIAICGTKTMTLPTPAMMPSFSRSRSEPGPSCCCTSSCAAPTPASISSVMGADHENSVSKTTYITATNTANPEKRCSSTASSLSVKVRFSSAGRVTLPATTPSSQV
jgi:hypothetical protein